MVPPTPKRMMWRVTEAPWRTVKVSVLFLCGVQLVLRSSVLTVLDLDEVDVTLRQVITVVCGSGIGEVLIELWFLFAWLDTLCE